MVHRFWMGPSQPGHLWTGAVARQMHQRAQVVEWTPETLPAEVAAEVEGEDPRHVSNLVRYRLLHRFGGLWLDHDIVPLRSLTGSPTPWTAALNGRREGCAMWFPEPDHPMLAALVEQGRAASALLTSPHRSGAYLLDQVGRGYPDVGYEPRVLPFDARGGLQRCGVDEPWAVHLWERSSTKHLQPVQAGLSPPKG